MDAPSASIDMRKACFETKNDENFDQSFVDAVLELRRKRLERAHAARSWETSFKDAYDGAKKRRMDAANLTIKPNGDKETRQASHLLQPSSFPSDGIFAKNKTVQASPFNVASLFDAHLPALALDAE
jgi:hypothetical protein